MTSTILLLAVCSALVSAAAAECVTCSTRGVTAFFDGCNQCSCNTNSTSGTVSTTCTERACAPNNDPTVCTGKCDGFVVPSDDGCGSCTCKSGRVDKCTTTTDKCDNPCSAVKCAFGKVCQPSPKQCITTPCPQFACVGPCDSNPCASGETCVEEPKQCLTLPCPQYRCAKPATPAPTNTCFNCKTAGVSQYFDGCNQCSCRNGTEAGCTKLACAAVVPDPTQCARQCDGFLTLDDGACGRCTCINGEKTRCSKCGVGSTCKTTSDGKSSCVAVVPPPAKACDAKPCAEGETCYEDPKQCITTPCPQYRCEKPTTNTCYNCKTAGITQYFDGCNQCSCRNGTEAGCTELACIALAPEPTQCARQCDGFLTLDDGACGRCTCINGEKTRCSKCGVGSTCKTGADGKSACVAVVPPPAKACDAKPCPSFQNCIEEPKQCLTLPCPQYRCEDIPNSYTCFNCKTAGVKSYYDGCNQCSCQADGSSVCTKRLCAALFQDPKQCAGHCDGFVTSDDGVCGACTCVNGEKTRCSKCGVGAGCKTNADGKSECVAVVPPPAKACDAKPCAENETCVEDPKECVTTPCPQFKCVPTELGKCFDCKTPGVKSFYDGCNTCTCEADGSALCTELACVGDTRPSTQCSTHCDGFLTDEDECGRCTCVNGEKTRCSKCGVGSTCKTVDGKSQCVAVVPPQTCTVCTSDPVCRNADVPKGDECNTCKCVDGKKEQCTSRPCSAQCNGVTQCAASGRICVAEPKQCLTSPCDQFACAEIGSEAAIKDAKLATVDSTDGAAQLSAMFAMVMAMIAMIF